MRLAGKRPLVFWGGALAVGMLVLRIVLINATYLLEDEAYYFIWSRHLSHGYVDHGPFLAYFLKLSSLLFGETSFGVRMLGVLSYVLLSLALYAFGKDLRDSFTGVMLAVAFNLTPFFAGASFVQTTDTPMLLFLFLAVWMYYRGFFINRNYLYLGGIFLGLAALSKIGAVFVGFGIAGYVLLSSRRNEHLRKKEVWISLLLALLMYSPFIVWNIQNDFAFVRLATGSLLSRKGGIVRFLEFWGAQAGLFTPLIAGYGIYLSVKTLVRRPQGNQGEAKFFLSMTSLVPLVYIVQKSFRNKLEANWGAFAFVGLLVLTVWHLSENWNRRKIRTVTSINFGIAVLFMLVVAVQAIVPVFPVPSRADATRRYYRSSVFEGEFKEYYQQELRKDVRIFGPNYQIPSMINFYTEPQLEAVRLDLGEYHATSYEYWYEDSSFVGEDFYFVTNHPPTDRVTDHFDQVVFIRNFDAMRGSDRVARYRLYYCVHYHGSGKVSGGEEGDK